MPLFLSFDPYESPTNATVVELGRFLGQKIDQSNETIELLRSERQQLISNSKDQSDKLLDQRNETIKLLRSERQQLISNSKDQSKKLLDLGARLKRELSYTIIPILMVYAVGVDVFFNFIDCTVDGVVSQIETQTYTKMLVIPTDFWDED
eukprot:scaffold109_cov294-Chaetoceros_neogracile.AAC.9